MNRKIYETLDWYQARIASYDKQQWEQSLDQKFLENSIYNVNKKTSKFDDYIDIDLVKGSTFSKAKSSSTLPCIFLNGSLRLLLYPVHFYWWKLKIGPLFATIFLIVYLIQLSNIWVYFTNKFDCISFGEILIPLIIMTTLSIMYNYIVSTLPVTNCDLDKDSSAASIYTNEKSSSKLINKRNIETTQQLQLSSDDSSSDEELFDQKDSSFLNGDRKVLIESQFSTDSESKRSSKKVVLNNLDQNNTLSLDAVSEKIQCIVWQNSKCKGGDLSMLELSNIIILNANNSYLGLDYFYLGIAFSMIISFLPILYRFNEILSKFSHIFTILLFFDGNVTNFLREILKITQSMNLKYTYLMTTTLVSTVTLSILFFSLLTIAERTLNQRLLHAKSFRYLTSNRKAKKHNLPHFRLNKVENIKTWLSIRSYLRRRGPQRSINAIISSTFLIGVVLCSIVCIQFLRDSEFLTNNLLNWQLVIWSLTIWLFMSRFMTIGFKINKKYRCMSTVIMEQINLHLQVEKVPSKKDELSVVNNVLKLAADLLKEIEKPFRISGLSVNPWIYNVTKVVLLSAFSAVLSELFGFKLKLYKIKIN